MDIENLEHVGYIRFTSVETDNQGVTTLNFEWIIRDGHQTGYVMVRGGEILDRTLNCPVDEHRIKSLPWIPSLSFKKFLDQVVAHPESHINWAYRIDIRKLPTF